MNKIFPIILALFCGAGILMAFFFGSSKSNKTKINHDFEKVTSLTKIIIISNNGQRLDCSGDMDVIDAINDLKYGHFLVGRDIGESVPGELVIDELKFSFRASMISGGHRIIIEPHGAEQGWWEGRKLGKIIISRFQLNDAGRSR